MPSAEGGRSGGGFSLGNITFRTARAAERDAARKEAERLSKKGFDVAVGGVPAYSTLGNFDDPVLNTMLRWDDIQLNGELLGGSAIRIEGATMLASDVLRLEISGASPAESYYPESTTSLVDGPWERIPHSDDWTHDFIETNLSYSATLGTNLVIYIKQSTSGTQFIRIKGVDGGAPGPVIRIEGMAMLAIDVLKLEVSGANPLASYCPASTLDLVGGTWERIAHSDDGVNPFIVTNLTYSATDGTNRFIYMQQSTNRTGFIRIQSVE